MLSLFIIFFLDKGIYATLISRHGLYSLYRKVLYEKHGCLALVFGVDSSTDYTGVAAQSVNVVRHALQHLDAHLVEFRYDGCSEFYGCHD